MPHRRTRCLPGAGLPGILRAWPHATPALTFLEQECADPASPVFSVPETSLGRPEWGKVYALANSPANCVDLAGDIAPDSTISDGPGTAEPAPTGP